MFTVVRLVETGVENAHFLVGMAQIRSYYRTITPDSGEYFSARGGRWPEATLLDGPAWSVLRAVHHAPPWWASSTASSPVPASRSLAANLLGRDQTLVAVLVGVAVTLAVMAGVVAYQRWRYGVIEQMVRPG